MLQSMFFWGVSCLNLVLYAYTSWVSFMTEPYLQPTDYFVSTNSTLIMNYIDTLLPMCICYTWVYNGQTLCSFLMLKSNLTDLVSHSSLPKRHWISILDMYSVCVCGCFKPVKHFLGKKAWFIDLELRANNVLSRAQGTVHDYYVAGLL